MNTQVNQAADIRQPRKLEPVSLTKYPPLTQVTRDLLTTDETAFYLGLKPQTLRKHRCEGREIIRSVTVTNKPMYKTADVRALISGGASK